VSLIENARIAVAVVDDEALLCNLYSVLLEKYGYDVVFVGSSGEEVLEAIASGKLTKDNLDIVLLDFHMGIGKIDGLETAIRIKENIPAAKIIIATADSSIEREVREAGVAFLSKPFSVGELLPALDQHVNGEQAGKELDQSVQQDGLQAAKLNALTPVIH
jgi:CheY-like chemotaxis protein